MGVSLVPSINPCSFCVEVELARQGQGLHFSETGDLIALPTLGCFVRGYSLIVPKRHYTSFACQTPKELTETEAFLEHIRSVSNEIFGPTILAEHGTGAPEEPTAACCDHAHFHVIPTTSFLDVLSTYQATGGPGLGLGSIQELSRFEGHSYLSLSDSPGKWTIWVGASRFPRQCIRRAVSKAEGDETKFDWRLHMHQHNMVETSVLFKYALRNSGGAR